MVLKVDLHKETKFPLERERVSKYYRQLLNRAEIYADVTDHVQHHSNQLTGSFIMWELVGRQKYFWPLAINLQVWWEVAQKLKGLIPQLNPKELTLFVSLFFQDDSSWLPHFMVHRLIDLKLEETSGVSDVLIYCPFPALSTIPAKPACVGHDLLSRMWHIFAYGFCLLTDKDK